MSEFIECDTCRAKPGTPTLCAECLRRRAIWSAGEVARVPPKPIQLFRIVSMNANSEECGRRALWKEPTFYVTIKVTCLGDRGLDALYAKLREIDPSISR